MVRKDIIEQSKQQLKNMLPSFIHLTALISVLKLLKPDGFSEVLLTITLINVIKDSHNIYEFKKFITKLIKSTITIALLYSVMFISLSYGAVGFVLYILVLSLWTMFANKTKRSNFMTGLRNIESSLFGKPLDKKEWGDEKPTININVKR